MTQRDTGACACACAECKERVRRSDYTYPLCAQCYAEGCEYLILRQEESEECDARVVKD